MKIEKIKEILGKNSPAYAKGNSILNNNLLVKNLDKFIRVGLSKSTDKVRGKAEVFRRLVVFSTILQDSIQALSDQLVEDKVAEYFPSESDPQKVIVQNDDGDKYAVVVPFDGKTDWSRALKRRKTESIAEGSYTEEKFK